MSPNPTDVPSTPPPPLPVILTASPLNDPPPPYPSRERRARTGRRSRRSTTTGHSHIPSGGTESDPEGVHGTPHASAYTFPDSGVEEGLANETTPLLGLSPTSRLHHHRSRQPSGAGIGGRPRTVSQSSTVFSGTSVSPSLAQTVVSAFRIDLDSDLDSEEAEQTEDSGRGAAPDEGDAGRRAGAGEDVDALALGPSLSRRKERGWRARWRRYYRPLGRRAYWSPLVHLLLLNFPYALLAWVYLFVFTLLGTILLVALPLGAVLCFFDLLGARTLARGEVLLQSTFHSPLAYSLDYPLPPIFTRIRAPTSAEVEAGIGSQRERSFYRNSYSMFTDSTSYQALFYFLVIKPGITILLSLLLIVLVPVSLLLIFPAPAMLRLVRRLGIWQANVAVEGLYMGGG